ncbi:MAG: CHASE3 domain-containing protein [Acidobacteria bacterium]|nr:CHASE3 domain-containing protein [Acidobacteriota bacterium]
MTDRMQPAQLPRPLRGQRRGAISILLGLAVALPFVTSLAAAGFVISGQRQLDAAMAGTTTALEVRRVSQTLLAIVLDVQSSQRGYVLTGDPLYLAPYESARRELPEHLRELSTLVARHETQVTRVRELDALATARVDFAADVVRLVTDGRGPEALAAVESGRGKRLTDDARLIIAGIDAEEAGIVVAQQRAAASDAGRQATALSALVVASTVTLVILMFMVRRMMAYEEIVRMCAWSRTIEYQGQWMSFEQYLQERFGMQTSHGISPDAARRVREQTEAEDRAADAGRPGAPR